MSEQWNNAPVKTIGIDCRFASGTSGLGRYTRSMVYGLLRRNDSIHYTLFVRSAQEEWLKHIPEQAHYTLHIADISHYSLSEQIRFPVIIGQSGIELFFSPHFNVPLLCPVPFIATVHDLILHRFPTRSVLKQWAYRTQMFFTVRKARSLCAVSSFTALEIGGRYGPQAIAKCCVTGEGVEASFAPVPADLVTSILKKYGLRQPFFLYVGTEKKHKNVSLLIQSFLDLHDDRRQLVLVTPHTKQQYPLEHTVIRLSDIQEEDLPALYCAAECFVSASLYEGYGLPIAEALSCGCPVIAGQHTGIPEASRGAAMLIEPTVAAFTDALRHPPKRPVAYSRPDWSEASARTAHVLLQALA